MADWLDVWSILGKEQGPELDMLVPVRMTVGGVKDPQKLSNLIPVMWVSSGLMDQGELEIHKQFFLGNLFKEPLVFYPSDYMPNAGLRDTLKYLAQMVHDANERGVESLAKQVLALFTAASMHEYEDSYFRCFKGESDEAERKIEEWLAEHQPFRFAWHRRSRTLGPNQSFLESMDFYEVLGTERPASIKELCQVIISGHRRVLDQYQLVVPSFQYEFRDEFESDLLDWWEDLQAREEKAAVQRQAIRDARAAKEQLHHERLEQKRRALLSPEKRNQEFPPLSWQNTGNERLQELLFEAPMTELAVRFSVSEAAIRKRVKSAGLSVPPRGHWLKKD